MIETSEGKMKKVVLKTNLRLFPRADHPLPFYGKGTVIIIPDALARELLTAKNVEVAPDEAAEKLIDLIHEKTSGPKFDSTKASPEVVVLIEEALERQKLALTQEFDKKLADLKKKG
jgi:hypothetical protein